MVIGTGESNYVSVEEIRGFFILFLIIFTRFFVLAKCRRKALKSYGQQIVIQSEQEKRLAKELRKEDKRLNRMLDKRQDGPSSEFVDVDVVRRRYAIIF